MKDYRTERLRNLGLFSHGGAGKTSLSEAMLFDAGAITRLGKVDEGNTTSDFDADEIKRKISVNVSLLPFEWQDHKVNLIDTPGYADFAGEVKEAMRVVDAALILVDAVAGVEVGTDLVWKYADERQLPRLIVVNRMDRENANFQRAVEQVQERYGSRCVPIQLPIGAQADFAGVIDLIGMKAYLGSKAEEAAVPAELADQARQMREKLVEAICETDDELITKYLEGEELSDEEIRRGLRAGVRTGQVVPILAGSALQNKGIHALLDVIVHYVPSPAEVGSARARTAQADKAEDLAADPSRPLAALVFKTTADPYVGKLTYLRMFSGTLHSDSHVWNPNRHREERIGQLLTVRGKTQEPTLQLIAGDIGAVAKLAETATGDTLCQREHSYTLPGIEFPRPAFSAAVSPKTKADLDKLGPALARIVEEDPTLSVHKDPDTNETVLSGMGESHIDVAVGKMKRKFGVDVNIAPPKVPYKETITAPTKAEYKHKKQTGGHGQYGHVFLEMEPLPRGTGIEFAERVVGGVVPKQYIPAVEKGVNEAVREGILARYPVVDVKTTLYDGSYHDVDSSEMAFKIATIQAFKKGLQQGRPVLLEPVMQVRVTVPSEFMGDVIGDLNSRRARVQGMTPEGDVNVIDAQAPLAEMQRYATVLRSLTQGRGLFTAEFSHYEEVPAHTAQGIVDEAKREAAKEQ